MRRGILGTACWMLLMQLCSHAQMPKPTEYQIKAAYLYNFAKFVTWPAGAAVTHEATVAICVLGEDPFGAMLDTAGAGLLIEGKPTIVRRVSTATAAADCGVLFIGSSGRVPLDEVIAAVRKRGVLTVSDMPDFTRRGGIIQFIIEGNRIRFEVNLAAADEAGLMLSSELLKVALAVRGTSRP